MKYFRFLEVSILLSITNMCLYAQDWPQWRGPNRDARATGFHAPAAWPSELKETWNIPVGDGVASPAIADNRIYVFSRQDGNEILRCLNTADGKEIWQDKYESPGASGPSQGFSGPRSSPVIANGKILTYGVRGTLSCLDAAKGEKLWRKQDADLKPPRFFTACSPLVSSNLCFVQLGGEEGGTIAAYDLSTGDQKWKWSEDGSAYASPILLSVADTPMLATITAKRIVGLNPADGKLLLDVPFPAQGRAYNAATPILNGDTIIISGAGRGTKAFKIEKDGANFKAREMWSNAENGVQFNTPVLKDGLLYGITQNGDLFCLNATDGKALWTNKLGGRGFGSVVDAGSVLFALTPQGDLIVFAPGKQNFKEVARYKVGSDTYAYPIPMGDGIYIKDKGSIALLALK